MKSSLLKYMIVFPVVLCLQFNNQNTVFLKHETKHMIPILKTLHNYAKQKARENKGVTEKMLQSQCKNIRGAQYYIQIHNDTSIYLGWIPLMNDTRMIGSFKPRINDNMGVPYRKVPIYFICAKPNPEAKVLHINQIFLNPSINIDIDLTLLKHDLEEYSKSNNYTLNTDALEKYDNSRWCLIWSESKRLSYFSDNEYKENKKI